MRETVEETLRAFRAEFFTATTWVIWFVASAVLVVAGPFGTFESMPISERLLFWPILLAVSLLISYSVRAAVTTVAQSHHQLSRDGIVIVLFSTFFAPMPTLIAELTTRDPQQPIMSLFEAYLLILIIASAVVIVRHVVGIESRSRRQDEDGDCEEIPRFLRRLDGHVRPEQVLRLTVDDHYVDVYLSNGETRRVLIRFADAVEEMDGLEGMCVHRSHWVASHAIRGVEKCGGREFVVLSDDSRVPVSRTYRPNLVEAGWIVDRRLKAAGQGAGAGPSAQQRPLVRTNS